MTRRRVATTVSVWIVLSIALAATDARPSVIVLFGIVAVVAAVIAVMVDLSREVIQVEWSRQRGRSRSTRGVDQRVNSLRTQLYSARWFGSNELRDALVTLIDDRLMVHRHIDRAAEPDKAFEVLTPALRRLVSGPRRPPGTGPRELQRILADIEAL